MKWRFLELGFCYRAVQDLIGGTRARRLAIERLLAFNGVGSSKAVLDVGCGVGDVLKWIPDNWSYIGIDISPEYIRLASSTWGKRGSFRVGSAADAHQVVAPESQDIVLFLGVLHHMDSATVTSVLESARRCLAPGGIAYALEPAFWSGQSAISRKVMSMDRGEFIRDVSEWRALCAKVFPSVEIDELPRALRIPYHKVTLTLRKS